jgi:hypothetical protein
MKIKQNSKVGSLCLIKRYEWDNTPLLVKYNPGLLDLLVLLDETGLQTGL